MKLVVGWVGSYFWNHGGCSFQKDTISDRWRGDGLVSQKYKMFSAFGIFQLFSKAAAQPNYPCVSSQTLLMLMY